MMFVCSILLAIAAGYDLGKGNPARAADILKKGEIYAVEAKVKNGNKVYAIVTNENGSKVYVAIFDNPPPAKFKVVEDGEGQIYLPVP